MTSISAWVLPCALALLLLGSCVKSEQPLSALKDARPDLRLVGTWRGGGNPDSKYDTRVSYDSRGLGRLVTAPEDNTAPSEPDNVTFFVTTTDQASYINLSLPDDDKRTGKGKHYQFFKYTVSEDQKTLHLWIAKLPAFQKAVHESKLKGKVESTDGGDPNQQNVLLQDSSAAILRYLESLSPEEAFADLDICRKVN